MDKALKPYLSLLQEQAELLGRELAALPGFDAAFAFSAPEFTERESAQLRKRLQGLLSPAAAAPAYPGSLPVLARLVPALVQHWRTAQLELARRCVSDFPGIQETFGRPGRVVDCGGEAGDTHAGGRAVRILAFEGGARVVYKPRPVEVDARFQDFLRWFNALEPRFALRPLAVLGREGYGWMQFVAQKRAGDAAAYGARMGSLLALLHLLGGTDIHFENVVAAGDQPVVIDLETLFHKYPRFEEARTAFELAQHRLLDSVFGVGILPTPIPLGGGNFLDAGALGGEILPRSPEPRRIPSRLFRAGDDRPVPLDREAIVAGYREAAELLAKDREELRAGLENFRSVRVRLVLQGTQFYQTLLREGYEPEHLGSEAARARHLARLRDHSVPALRHFIPSELAQLEDGDVPYFFAAADENVLRDPAGRPVGDLTGKTGWRISVERCEALGLADRERQLNLINATLGRVDAAHPTALERLRALNGLGALDRAVAAGEELARSAIVRGDSATWISARPFFAGEPGNLVSPLGHGLDNGIAGIALFFAYLYHVTKAERFGVLARQCVNSFEEVHHLPSALRGSTDVFEGAGTAAYLYAHLGPTLGVSPPSGVGAFSFAPERIPAREQWAHSWCLWSGVAGYGFDALLEAAPGGVPQVFKLAGPLR